MSGKSKLSLFFSCAAVFCLLLAFNNCAPLGSPLSGVADFSSGGDAFGKTEFANVVTPAFVTACQSCHAANGTATPAIFTYGFARAQLLDGLTSIDNKLMKKLNGGTAHTPGILCANDTVSPCKELKRWAVIEAPMKSTIAVGQVTSISNSGEVKGWAINPQSLGTTVTVSLYGNTSFAGGGTLTMNVQANGNGAAPYSGHYFTAQLPASLVDATTRNLYAYAGGTSDDALFLRTPTSFKAYGPTTAGSNYYTSNVQPAMAASSCNACHNGSIAQTFTYTSAFELLISPYPDKGGTATTNAFIRNALGQLAHGGGKVCANDTVQPCATFKTWWTTEFVRP